jgi:hypothetical protein
MYPGQFTHLEKFLSTKTLKDYIYVESNFSNERRDQTSPR